MWRSFARVLWRVFQKSPEKHFIDHGRVFCPQRGHDVEADLCAGCRWIVEVREDGVPPYLTCQPGPEPLFQRRGRQSARQAAR